MWPVNGKFATWYKYWMLVHSLVVAIFYVYRIAFEEKPDFSVVLLEYYLDVVYLVDMIRIFTSPYNNEFGKLVTDSRMIIIKYVKTWFFLDIYCFFPLA
jgi:hypothetical protein